MDQATGLLEATSERELFLIVIGVLTGGGLVFALSWKIAGMVQVILVRVMDLLDRLHHDTDEKEN